MKPSEWIEARTQQLYNQPPYNESMMGGIPAQMQAVRELFDFLGAELGTNLFRSLRVTHLDVPDPSPLGPTGLEISDLPVASGANGPAEPASGLAIRRLASLVRWADEVGVDVETAVGALFTVHEKP